jgi:hypothetical protein
MQAETGVAPPEEFADQSFVNSPLSKEQPEHATAKEVLQRVEVNLRKRHEPPGWCERAVGHQRVQVRVEIDEVAACEELLNSNIIFH